jgi:hypothetical protein
LSELSRALPAISPIPWRAYRNRSRPGIPAGFLRFLRRRLVNWVFKCRHCLFSHFMNFRIVPMEFPGWSWNMMAQSLSRCVSANSINEDIDLERNLVPIRIGFPHPNKNIYAGKRPRCCCQSLGGDRITRELPTLADRTSAPHRMSPIGSAQRIERRVERQRS